MKDEILSIPNESILDTNLNEQLMDDDELLNEDNSLNLVSNEESNNEENQLNNNIDTTTDCLALTVRENYHVVVVKNFFKKGFRVSWKVALSMFTINFLNFFL